MKAVQQLAGGGELTLFDPWLLPDEAARLFDSLRSGVPWRHEKLVLFGREILQPRLTAWYGDPGAGYTYSGLTLSPEPWTAVLSALRARVEEAAAHSFNSVLLNYYRDGNDSVGFHADDEKELGENPVIASVSLGATRLFVLRPVRKHRDARAVRIALRGGSLLVMGGATQHAWRHSLPKQPGEVGARINLTFRRVDRA